ncbi:MAG: TonB-dependent receptor, partial [Bacteroidales bacterium]
SKYAFAPFTYNFSLGFSWKDLNVNALFTGEFGHDVIYDKGFYADASGGKRSGAWLSENSNNLREWYGNYWTPENTDARYPRIDNYGFKGYRSTFWMRDGHTLRLRNLSISYGLPQKYAKAIDVDALRVFFQGTNLLTLINPYPYKDASVGFWSDYPQIRTFNLGINLSF